MLLTLATAATVAASTAAGVAPGVYAGASRRANRHMDITIQVLAGGRCFLVGHATPSGFAGTFHYRESDHHGYRCDSRLLHWSARRTPRSLP